MIFPKRGVAPYSAKQIASRIVDLPAPVGPVMAKIPLEQVVASFVIYKNTFKFNKLPQHLIF